ncbi:MFS transporter [Nocardiopsis sp. NPDC050513]|uniref:MFS transporter n=1 Tax=Nocardiopsis sp. NPDC050513 TaxID=3364338 RepID=UPI003799E831
MPESPTPSADAAPAVRTAPVLTVASLCTATITVEGYDLIVYGVALPSLSTEPGWGMNAGQIGMLGSLAYVGMLVGALVCGHLSDRWGRRRLILASIAVFTVCTGACAVATAPWQFGALRLLAGVGMGGVMPSVVALTKEFAPRRRASLIVTLVLAGIPVGGSIAALTAALWLPLLGWRGLFAVGAALSVGVLALVLWRLPESGAHGDAHPVSAPHPRGTVTRELLVGRRGAATLLFVLANFTILLTWYGLNTWLTQLMREMDYPLGSALRFTLILNLGAVLGSFVLAAAADRLGRPRLVAAVAAALTACSVVALLLGSAGTGALLASTALAGVGAQSALTMMNASVSATYPRRIRATALGWVSGFGRIGAIAAPLVGGWILQAALGPVAVFAAFAVSAALSAVFFAAVPLRERELGTPGPVAAEPTPKAQARTR